MEQQDHAVLLFDGVCHLCNSSVQFVLKRDHSARFQFASLQSDVASQLLATHIHSQSLPDSVLLLYKGRLFSESDAAIKTLILLGGFWKLAILFRVIPRFIRNAIYRWVAKNRYRWFGKYESCQLPEPQWKSRFLD